MDYSKFFIVKTFCPGWKHVDIKLDKAYQRLLEAEKNDTLRNLFPTKEGVNREASNFHSRDMLYSNYGKNIIKKELITLEVPLKIEDADGNMVDNEEGITYLDDEAKAVFVLADITSRGIKPILDRHGRQLSEAGKAMLQDMITGIDSEPVTLDLVHPSKKATARKD